jgi:hypothetical protein
MTAYSINLEGERGRIFGTVTRQGKSKLIIYAHGVWSGTGFYSPEGRELLFYGPDGKVCTFPPLADVFTSDANTVPLEIYDSSFTGCVADYSLKKYANRSGSAGKYPHNKLDITEDDILGDLSVGGATDFHVFSVRNRNILAGGSSLRLSEVVASAERFNGQRYKEVYCFFCRGRKGTALRGATDHSYLDNKNINRTRGGPAVNPARTP